ncbi:hypothetical protein J3R30DRAFT_3451887 [Lentinula aciculospora]|uniref:Uncharacterized protein n=1 Tax=Lentinula aciculospora TaxID=153920 RepID=A0A9W9DSQ0_9AGAR|nr:hypothetical protein J3R30DRAFT_3451887 [Lentinula aciculospora]
MKFTTSPIIVALFTFTLANCPGIFAAPSPVPVAERLSVRVPTPGDCVSLFKFTRGVYHGTQDQSCVNLVENCRFTVADNNITDIWGVKSCVAAATCQGVTPLIEMVQCTQNETGSNVTVPDASQTESLDYNIYASIVGDCAWQEGGCPITQQNYIDFVYGTLSDIATSTWPDVNNVITNWWDYITQWTATGETVPYLNFNDWLHYSNSQ